MVCDTAIRHICREVLVNERLLIDDKVFQISLRGTGYGPADYDWGRDRG